MYGNILGYLFLVGLILIGLLALTDIIRTKNPQAAENLSKLSVIGGYLGVIVLVLSVTILIRTLRWLSVFFRVMPLSTLLQLLAVAAGIALGLFYAFDVLKNWGLMKEEKAGALAGKMQGIIVPCGFIAVGTGLYFLVFYLVGGWAL